MSSPWVTTANDAVVRLGTFTASAPRDNRPPAQIAPTAPQPVYEIANCHSARALCNEIGGKPNLLMRAAASDCDVRCAVEAFDQVEVGVAGAIGRVVRHTAIGTF